MSIKNRFSKLNREIATAEDEYEYVLPQGLITEFHCRLIELKTDAISNNDTKLQEILSEYILNFEEFHF